MRVMPLLRVVAAALASSSRTVTRGAPKPGLAAVGLPGAPFAERLCVGVQVYYNNVLSLPLIGVLMWWYGELTSLRKEEALQNPMFLVAACASALVIPSPTLPWSLLNTLLYPTLRPSSPWISRKSYLNVL